MIGLIVWKKRDKKDSIITAGECMILHMRCFKMEVAREDHTPEILLRRRTRIALGRLRKAGITQVVLPEDFSCRELLEKQGLREVSTLPLRRRLAADWVHTALMGRTLSGGSVRVAVSADRLTGEVVRTVTELVLRYRYVMLDLPEGGEELCRQLRREYGVTLMLSPSQEQMAEAEARVLFDRREEASNPVCIRLYDENQPLPKLVLPPLLEQQLPQGIDRVRLLSALQEAGAIKPGQLTLESSCS